MCKLLITAALYVGRIDTPLLAPGIGQVGQLELDSYPSIFLKDVLSHEAHRHPYIELLGVMYLMKVRYRQYFGNRAGSTWRLIFVYALMPWLNKYRVTRRIKEDEEVIEDTVRLRSTRNGYCEHGVDDDPDDAPSSLMTRFKSLRTSYVPEQEDKLPLPVNLMRKSLTGHSSKRASLLLKELESERVNELEMEKAGLQEEVDNMHGQVVDLQGEVERLQRLLQEKDKSTELVYQEKVSSASNTKPLNMTNEPEESTVS